MSSNRILVTAEAVVSGLPLTLLSLVAIPALAWSTAGAIFSSLEMAWLAAPLLCGFYSLFQYWRLTVKTARGRVLSIGAAMWCAIGAAVVGAFFLFTFLSSKLAAALLIGGPAFAAAHLLFVQHEWARSLTASEGAHDT